LEHFLTANRMPLCLKMLDDFTATIMDCREFPRDRGAIPVKSRKNKQREKYPAPGAGLIAAGRPESRRIGQKTGQNQGISRENSEQEVAMANKEGHSPPAICHTPFMKPTGSPLVVLHSSIAGAQWLRTH
jgi:hypothetical protein